LILSFNGTVEKGKEGKWSTTLLRFDSILADWFSLIIYDWYIIQIEILSRNLLVTFFLSLGLMISLLTTKRTNTSSHTEKKNDKKFIWIDLVHAMREWDKDTKKKIDRETKQAKHKTMMDG